MFFAWASGVCSQAERTGPRVCGIGLPLQCGHPGAWLDWYTRLRAGPFRWRVRVCLHPRAAAEAVKSAAVPTAAAAATSPPPPPAAGRRTPRTRAPARRSALSAGCRNPLPCTCRVCRSSRHSARITGGRRDRRTEWRGRLIGPTPSHWPHTADRVSPSWEGTRPAHEHAAGCGRAICAAMSFALPCRALSRLDFTWCCAAVLQDPLHS